VVRPEVTRQLLALGVRPGSVLVVHTAFSRVAPIEGGPKGLIEALAIAAPHPLDVPHGLDSPVGRAYEMTILRSRP
jgi:aminoglycoside N3'-acetyltransferase